MLDLGSNSIIILYSLQPFSYYMRFFSIYIISKISSYNKVVLEIYYIIKSNIKSYKETTRE